LAFGVRRSAFGVRRSAFGVWRLAFGVWRATFTGTSRGNGLGESVLSVFEFSTSKIRLVQKTNQSSQACRRSFTQLVKVGKRL
jgi:hypothetical protein